MTEPRWVDPATVVAIHDRLLAEHGGPSGIRDRGLLESALARPRQLYSCGEPDLFDLAAAYTAGILNNHPFVDGNKRTGFVTGILFLELNGMAFDALEAEATKAVVDLAAGDVEQDVYAFWLRDNSARP